MKNFINLADINKGGLRKIIDHAKLKKKKALKPYQVNKKIMNVTKKDSIFMHCFPSNRGEEVTNEIVDGQQSAVWLEAFNRIHVQKSIIEWCLK